jgi:hypothetical protein
MEAFLVPLEYALPSPPLPSTRSIFDGSRNLSLLPKKKKLKKMQPKQ